MPPSLTGGYLDSNATPGNALTLQFQFVDDALGQFIAGTRRQRPRRLDADHRQRQARPVADRRQGPRHPVGRAVPADPGYGTHGFEICDDEGLIWLEPDLQQANYDAAKAYLLANAGMLHIQELLDRDLADPALRRPVREQPRA